MGVWHFEILRSEWGYELGWFKWLSLKSIEGGRASPVVDEQS
jgi:hypothetical protein